MSLTNARATCGKLGTMKPTTRTQILAHELGRTIATALNTMADKLNTVANRIEPTRERFHPGGWVDENGQPRRDPRT